jgi:hypothetical protein
VWKFGDLRNFKEKIGIVFGIKIQKNWYTLELSMFRIILIVNEPPVFYSVAKFGTQIDLPCRTSYCFAPVFVGV